MNKLFNEQEIIQLYQKFVVKSQEYYNKLSPLPLQFNNKNWKWEGKDFPRIACLIDFNEWINKYKLNHVDSLLCTDLSDPEIEYITHNTITCLPYGNGKNDLHTLITDKEYDFMIFNQTIEHLYNPFVSMENLYKCVKKDGYLFTSVPTINIPHMLPFHFNGFTPLGLCMLMKSAGFEVVELGYWGNYNYLNKLFLTHRWPSYEDLIDSNLNISNEPNNVAQCWILVKK